MKNVDDVGLKLGRIQSTEQHMVLRQSEIYTRNHLDESIISVVQLEINVFYLKYWIFHQSNK